MRRMKALAGVVTLFCGSWAQAQVTVWVDFTSDLHNGVGGGPNGKADWIDELDKCTAGAGVTTFTAAERLSIQTDILSQLGTIWSGYDIAFTTTMPGSGSFDAIAYGKTSFGFTALGIAPVDPANIASGQVGGIATGNFDFILDEFTGTVSRPTQLAQIGTALAGTGAHELGHTFGLMHHHAYSDPLIKPVTLSPATYAPTGGLQNKYIIASGETGLTEAGREVLRTFSPWEKAILDMAGGASAAYPTLQNQKLVTTPIPILMTEDGPFDAGSTPPTSLALPLAPGATSGMKLGLAAGDLDGTPSDMDMYKIFVTEPSLLCAEIFSDNRFASPFDFDSVLLLLDATGAPITMNDDVLYTGDTYNAGLFQQDDSYLLNIPVAPGIYHLLVHASPSSSITPDIGDAYWLAVGVAPIPEPASIGWLTLATTLCFARLRRSRSK